MKNMICMIDTNILLDVLCKRAPYYKDSSLIWKMCETKMIKGCVSVLSFADIVYVLRKQLDPEQIHDTLQKLTLIFEFVELLPEDLMNASLLKWNDYEDSIQETIALRIKSDYIITRNTKDYSESKCTVLTPEQLTKILI